jgi:hypothetical protein
MAMDVRKLSINEQTDSSAEEWPGEKTEDYCRLWEGLPEAGIHDDDHGCRMWDLSRGVTSEEILHHLQLSCTSCAGKLRSHQRTPMHAQSIVPLGWQAATWRTGVVASEWAPVVRLNYCKLGSSRQKQQACLAHHADTELAYTTNIQRN